jgi:hypothetical protein
VIGQVVSVAEQMQWLHQLNSKIQPDTPSSTVLAKTA